jgi:hypothetical protein
MVALGGREGNSSYSFLTSALDGGEWWASRPGRALPPERGPPVLPIGWEAGWVPEPVWIQGLNERSFAPAEDRTPVVQSLVRHYTDWATPGSMSSVSDSNYSCEQLFILMKNVKSRARARLTDEQLKSVLVENLVLMIILLFVWKWPGRRG